MRLLALSSALLIPLVGTAQGDPSAKLDAILAKIDAIQQRTADLDDRVRGLEGSGRGRGLLPAPYLRQPVRWPIYYGSPQSGWVLVGYSDTLPDGLGPINAEAAELTRRYLTNYRSVGPVERSGYSPPKLGLQPPGSPDYLPDR